MSPSIAQRLLDVQSRLRRLDAVLEALASKPIVPTEAVASIRELVSGREVA